LRGTEVASFLATELLQLLSSLTPMKGSFQSAARFIAS